MEKRTAALVGIIIAIIIIGTVAYLLWPRAPPKPAWARITIYYNAGNTVRERIAGLLARYWGELGFDVSVQALEWPTLLSKMEDPQGFDVYIIGWGPDFVDPDDYAYPLFYGGTQFSTLEIYVCSTASEVSNYVAPGAKVFEVEDGRVVVVGEKGTGFTPTVSATEYIVVAYKVDWEHTKSPEELMPYVTISPPFYRNITADALIMAGEIEARPEVRKYIYQAVEQISNWEVPMIWCAHAIYAQHAWTWVNWDTLYYHPVLEVRYDLVTEAHDAPNVEIGTLSGGVRGTSTHFYNNWTVWSIITFGWPDTWDPAANYESFGWELFHQCGDTLVTYWKEETEYADPDLAVAWARNADGTEWYFVIRGNVTAYNPWVDVIKDKYGTTTQETYTINATDVLFAIWRIARLGLDPSWMITCYVDVNASQVLTEEEFNSLLNQTPLIAEWRGKSAVVHNLTELLNFFNYNGPTAGVVKLKLYMPYPAILAILADPFTTIYPMKYVFDLCGWDYTKALADSNYGKDPSAWANYIVPGAAPENETSHLRLHEFFVGTGPYYVYDYYEGSWIVLHKNPYYWNATIWNNYGGFDNHKWVVYVIQSEEAPRTEMYTKGAGDVAAIPPTGLLEINGTTYEGTSYKIKVIRDPNRVTYVIQYIVLNTLRYPFNITKVRQALAYATPYDQIIHEIYMDFAIQLYGVIPQRMLGYTEKGIIKWTFNLTKAKELIKESGIFASVQATALPAFILEFILPVLVLGRKE